MTSPTIFAHLRYGAIRREAHLPHRVEHAAVRRLQPVAHVGQRAPDDYAHRVIHVRALHLVFDVDGELVQRYRSCRDRARAGGRATASTALLDIEILDVERVVFDELAPRLDLVAHQRREHQVGFHVIFGADLRSVRVSGFIVVSHSVSGFISPRPL